MSARREIFSRSSNSLKSELQIADFEEDILSYKSVLDEELSVYSFNERRTATPSRHSIYSKTPIGSRINSSQSTINKSKRSTAKSKQRKLESKIACRLQYIGFSLISMGCAFAVMIIWYTVWLKENKDPTEEVKVDNSVKSNFSCQYWDLAGDGYCDDEANVPECGYDFNDCCETQSDRSLCQNCTCYVSENKMEEYKKDNCQKYLFRLHLGDGNCNLNYNKEEYFFDIGDCCLEMDQDEYSCTYKHESWGLVENATQDLVYLPCRDDCIKSNNFCISDELGDGICQDHNNGPYCDYDMGDCCLPGDHPLEECCNCACSHFVTTAHTGFYWLGRK